MNQFETKRNRITEDKKFCDGIYTQIFQELELLSRTYDDQMAEIGYGRSWAEKIARIKLGEKLDAEPEIRKIILDIAFANGLSDIEREYLLGSIFKSPRYRKTDDD